MGGPLPVALCIVIDDGNLLLIHRAGDRDYTGKWAFPGGKIETDEHVLSAAQRELLEETGVEATSAEHRGVISKHRFGSEALEQHTILHICVVQPQTHRLSDGAEGDARWIPLDDLDDIRDDMIPNDRYLLDQFVINEAAGYFEVAVKRQDDSYQVQRFDQINSIE